MSKLFTYYYILCICAALPTPMLAQRDITITGTLLSAKENRPVIYAHIYIPNTTYGAYSNDQGQFIIRAKVWESFEMIISHLEHELMQLSLNSTDSILRLQTIYLQPKTYELKEVVVKENKNWEKYYDLFVQQFIGKTPGSNRCRIINKTALNFDYDTTTHLLTAWAYEPLLIENNHLGYRIRYDLVDFQFESARGNLMYKGFPSFELMEKAAKRQVRRWEKHRREAYKGSVMHFIRSLYHDKLAEEQFEMIEMARMATFSEGMSLKMNQAEVPTERKFLVQATELGQEALRLQTESRIIVKYKGAPESFDYVNQLFLRSNPAKYQSSTIQLRTDFVLIYSDGQVHDGADLILDGYFAWGRVAQMLPYDYKG